MSNIGAGKARERKQQKLGGPTQPPKPAQFVICRGCMTPHVAGTSSCEKCGLVEQWVAAQNTDGMTLDQMRRFADSVRETTNRTAMAIKRWIATFGLYTLMLERGDDLSTEELSMFWVRLHGVLAELPEHLAAGYFAGTTEAQARQHRDPNVVRYAAAHATATEAAHQIGKLITDDEHVYAEWRRHTECHLRQSAFTVQIQGKIGEPRKLKAQSTIKARSNAGPIQVEQLNASIRRCLAANGGDDVAVARAIAKRILPAATELAEAWEQFP